ncbi:tRNA guanosine(34) transglycosylase Tgt [bacterium]|nr:tRNA guanosine(34) transglycosylase Tgt [bacterium]
MKKCKGKIVNKEKGNLNLPFYMPDATRGLVKSLSIEEVKKTKTKAMVVNTLHLYLQPGLEIIKKAGGIHKFMNWPGYLLSDSGGFQVFSLIHSNSKLGKIYDDKVIFKSPNDGSKHELTPEKSIQIQFTLGTDMMVVLDDCPPYDISDLELKKSVERTISWAKRAKKEYLKQIKKRKMSDDNRPLLFAVIQGGKDVELRRYCFEELEKIGFDGFGFGARPVDENGVFLGKVLKETAEMISDKYLKFALGIGTIEDIYRCYKMGWEIFDCVIPTREGRHGRLLMKGKSWKKPRIVNINNAKFSKDFHNINPESNFTCLKENSLAYLNHLFKIKESLGQKMASLNNLEYYQKFLSTLKKEK